MTCSCFREIRAIRGSLPFLSVLRFLFGLALFFLFPFNAGALEAFTPAETMDGVFIGKYVEHFVDPTKRLTLADVRSGTFRSQFVTVNRDTLDFGISEAAHWIHLTVNNPADKEIDWILQAEHPLLNHIEVYEIRQNSEIKFHEGGSQIPFGRREIVYRKSAFSMTAPPGTSMIFIKAWSEAKATANCSLTAWGTNNFMAKNSIDTLLLGLYYGALLVMCLYNLFIYSSVRDDAYLLYVAYILLAGLGYFVANGLVFQYLWLASPYAGLRFVILSFALAILFSRSFLDTKGRMPKIDKLLLAFSIFFLLNGLLLFAETNSSHHAMTVAYFSALFFPPLLIYTGIRSLREGVRQARYYVVAWTIYLAGVMLYFLKDFGVLPYSFLTAYSMQIGTLADVILLSFALADRIKILREEKEAAQNQVLTIAEEARDNLEKKVAERTSQLAESETRFRQFSDAAFEGIVVHDQGIIIDVNKMAAEIYGYEIAELIGKNGYDLLVHPDHRKELEENVRASYKEVYEAVGLRKDRTPVHLEIRGREIIHQGKKVRVVAIRDITDRKKAERELQAAKEQAENATRLKDKFVTLVTHDLKSPLSSLTVGLETLRKDEELSSVNRHFIGKLAAHSRELLTMTERLLDLSRLQTGRIIPQKRFINCRGYAAAQIGLYQGMAAKKEIAIVNDIPEGMKVYADPDLFGECVKNVLSNALKFCDKGDTVTFFNPPDMPSTIAVKDNGPGIAPEKMPLLFTAEIKERSLGTAGEKGTGIGLPHTKELLEAHGGGITIESAPGRGATFFLTLPPTFNATMLVVDDQESVRAAIREHCAGIFPGILEAENGAEALEIIKNVTPHIIITDINMPVINGLEFIQMVRNDGLARRVPIIAMTSDESWPTPNGMDIRSYTLHLGADDFVNKPVAANDLVPRITRLLQGVLV